MSNSYSCKNLLTTDNCIFSKSNIIIILGNISDCFFVILIDFCGEFNFIDILEFLF